VRPWRRLGGMFKYAAKILWNYVVLGRPQYGFASRYMAAADVLMGDIMEKAWSGECPFCGRRFTRLDTHLRKANGCSQQFYALLRSVISYAEAARRVLWKSKEPRNYHWTCRICGKKFKQAYEAYRHALEHHLDAVENWLQLISGPAVSGGSQHTSTAEDASIL